MKVDCRFYVYAYFEPGSDTPFYIGKGAERRAYDHIEPRYLAKGRTFFYSKLRGMIRRGVRPLIEFLHSELTESEAFTLERDIIAKYGRRDLGTGCLCNLTEGGDGASGYKQSPGSIEKRAAALRGRKHSPERVEKAAAARRGKTPSPEAIERAAAARRGSKWRPEAIARVRGRKRSAGATELIVAALRGRKRPPEVGVKISQAKYQAVKSTNPKTGEVRFYPSAIAATADGFTKSGISTCCNGKAKSHRGLIWSFAEPDRLTD